MLAESRFHGLLGHLNRTESLLLVIPVLLLLKLDFSCSAHFALSSTDMLQLQLNTISRPVMGHCYRPGVAIPGPWDPQLNTPYQGNQ